MKRRLAQHIAATILAEPWKSSTVTTLERQAERLLGCGVPEGIVMDVLESVVVAMQEEYSE